LIQGKKQVVVFIVYIILALLRNIKDKNKTANRSQLHTRLQYSFYWLFNNTIEIYYKQFEQLS